MHGSENVLFRRYAHLPLLVISQDDHVLALISKMLVEVGSHVSNIINTSSQLASLAEIVDSDQEGFPPACAFRILVCVALWCSMAKGLWPAR